MARMFTVANMSQSQAPESAYRPPLGPETTTKSEWPYRQHLPGFYRAVGLAAVVRGLDLPWEAFEPGLQQAIIRGARHLSSGTHGERRAASG
jgi:hypothetical protein